MGILVVFHILMFGIPLTQIATEIRVSAGVEDMPDRGRAMTEYYGSLDRTLLALYKTLSDGVHWGTLQDSMTSHAASWVNVFFVLYSGLSAFAVLNIVTGFFVDTSLRAAEASRKEHLLSKVIDSMKRIDCDHSNTISLEEFMAGVEDPAMLLFLEAVDLMPQDADKLFKLMDTDDSGLVDQEELIASCIRLTGQAKSFELAAFMDQVEKDARVSAMHFAYVEKCLTTIMLRLNVPTVDVKDFVEDMRAMGVVKASTRR